MINKAKQQKLSEADLDSFKTLSDPFFAIACNSFAQPPNANVLFVFLCLGGYAGKEERPAVDMKNVADESVKGEDW